MEVRSPVRSTSFVERIRRFFGAKAPADADRITALEAECEQLRERVRTADERGRSRSGLLYDLQRQYSTEHFELQESMRNLTTERMRNAGMFADRDIVLARAKRLQARIKSLKERLRKHEPVEDIQFDEAPIVIEEASADLPSDPGADPGSSKGRAERR